MTMCDDCNGQGIVHDNDGNEFNCENCNGQGEIVESVQPVVVKITAEDGNGNEYVVMDNTKNEPQQSHNRATTEPRRYLRNITMNCCTCKEDFVVSLGDEVECEECTLKTIGNAESDKFEVQDLDKKLGESVEKCIALSNETVILNDEITRLRAELIQANKNNEDSNRIRLANERLEKENKEMRGALALFKDFTRYMGSF